MPHIYIMLFHRHVKLSVPMGRTIFYAIYIVNPNRFDPYVLTNLGP
jgi:FtsZ-interacting cell division protein ZipA